MMNLLKLNKFAFDFKSSMHLKSAASKRYKTSSSIAEI